MPCVVVNLILNEILVYECSASLFLFLKLLKMFQLKP